MRALWVLMPSRAVSYIDLPIGGKVFRIVVQIVILEISRKEILDSAHGVLDDFFPVLEAENE